MILGSEIGDKWGGNNVQYMISNQVPSLLYNIFVLAMYYVYVKRKESYWKFIVQNFKDRKMAISLLPAPSEPASEGEKQNLISAPEEAPGGPGGVAGQNMYFGNPVAQMQSMYKIQPAWHMPIQMPKKQQLLMNSSAFVQMEHGKTIKENDNGPVTNEFNVIVCIILLLGGIANLGLSRAYLLETEAQLVILSLVMFCVLEIGRSHLFSYFWYAITEEKKPADKYERFAIVFIDFVVLLLQLFIVFIWQYTMGGLIGVTDGVVTNTRWVLVFILVLFLITRLISVGQAIVEVFCLPCCSKQEKIDESYTSSLQNMTLVYSELVIYVIVMLVFILFLFSQSLPMKYIENPEKNLIFHEQMIYQQTKEVSDKANPTCGVGIQKNTLISDNKELCDYNSDNVYKLSPVTMKVFAWTRFYILQEDSKTRPEVLFCSNGLEQHWGQCKNLFLYGGSLGQTWDDTVKSAIKVTS